MTARRGPAIRRGLAVLVLVGVLGSLLTLMESVAPARAAGSHDQIIGSGSSWAYNAVLQWDSDVYAQGLQVVFTSTGSAQGRQEFGTSSNDFAVSDIGYQGIDPLTGQTDASPRPYVYLPIVAGGTSFPYQIRVGGQLVRNLRLSGQTLAKIFTNQITNWSDQAITADNNGRQLPDIPIVPVIHSEGSGSTAQFTTYLDTVYPGIWRPFIGGGASSLPPGKAFTEYFPTKGSAVPENGSDGVMNFVSAGGSNGAIAYDEYSYPKNANFPAAKIENAGGYFTLPDQYNVAVALTQAQIDPTSLLQTLTGVYSYNDPRTYPLSSYSYGIIPTSASDPRMTTAKRQTLVDYLYYAICGGQKEMGPIGYSPLPLNLVQASFNQINLLKAADPAVDITARDPTTCSNPTFDAKNPTKNLLAEIAPQPPACDQANQGPCDASGKAVVVAGNAAGGDTSQPGATGQSGGPAGAGPAVAGSAGAAGGGAAGKGSGVVANGAKSGSSNGKGSATGSTGGAGQTTQGLVDTSTATAPAASKTSLADGPPGVLPYHAAGATRLLVPLSVVLLALVLVVPPVLILAARRPHTREE